MSASDKQRWASMLAIQESAVYTSETAATGQWQQDLQWLIIGCISLNQWTCCIGHDLTRCMLQLAKTGPLQYVI